MPIWVIQATLQALTQLTPAWRKKHQLSDSKDDNCNKDVTKEEQNKQISSPLYFMFSYKQVNKKKISKTWNQTQGKISSQWNSWMEFPILWNSVNSIRTENFFCFSPPIQSHPNSKIQKLNLTREFQSTFDISHKNKEWTTSSTYFAYKLPPADQPLKPTKQPKIHSNTITIQTYKVLLVAFLSSIVVATKHNNTRKRKEKREFAPNHWGQGLLW